MMKRISDQKYKVEEPDQKEIIITDQKSRSMKQDINEIIKHFIK